MKALVKLAAAACLTASPLACGTGPAAQSDEPQAAALDAGGDASQPSTSTVERRLAQMLEGQFDSADQAKKDRAYFSVTLRACEAKSPLGPHVLYVEQALTDARDAPYRQRLYVIERTSEDRARSRVFELVDPSSAVGACERDSAPSFDATAATELVGCAVDMVWTGDHFEGRTPDMAWDGAAFRPSTTPDACKNERSGARYATSEVALFADRLVSWDRGYDGAGRQVWGATKGGYVFVRREIR